MPPCCGFFKNDSHETWQVLVEYNEKKIKKHLQHFEKCNAWVCGHYVFQRGKCFFFFQKAHWPIIVPMTDVWHLFDKYLFIEKMRLSNFKFIFSEFQHMRNNYAKCIFFVYL